MPASTRSPVYSAVRPVRPEATRPAVVPPLVERNIDELQFLLDQVPKPLEPLDVSMLDGFLCGVLVQPQAVSVASWLPHITDVDGRRLPPGFDAVRLHELARLRHRELNEAISRRQWFDPWVFELTPEPDSNIRAEPTDFGDRISEQHGGPDTGADAVYPWVAGFATALELFPHLMSLAPQRLIEPLALVYRHLAADDLEDAEDLLVEIDSLEPVGDLSEAVEGLVRATLLLADVAQQPAAPATVPRLRSRRSGTNAAPARNRSLNR